MANPMKVLILGAGEIGRAAAKKYLSKGCGVVVCDNSDDRLKAAEGFAGTVTPLLLTDLTLPEAAGNAVSEAVEKLGGLDVYVHAPVEEGFVPFEAMTYAQWRSIRKHSIDCGFIWGQQVGKKLRDLGTGGSIIYVSCDLCARQDDVEVARCAAAWGLKGLVRCMALALGPFGVAVNAVCYHQLDTCEDNDRRKAEAAYLGVTPEELKERLLGRGLTCEFQTTADIAELCDFLTSEAVNISGQAILLNGGAAFN